MRTAALVYVAHVCSSGQLITRAAEAHGDDASHASHASREQRRLLQEPAGTDIVRLGLLLPMSGWSAGKFITGAATLAIADANSAGILPPGRRLEYAWQDSGCNAIKGISALVALLEGPPIHGIIGASCSSACESTAFLAAGRELPQVSNGWSGHNMFARSIGCSSFARNIGRSMLGAIAARLHATAPPTRCRTRRSSRRSCGRCPQSRPTSSASSAS